MGHSQSQKRRRKKRRKPRLLLLPWGQDLLGAIDTVVEDLASPQRVGVVKLEEVGALTRRVGMGSTVDLGVCGSSIDGYQLFQNNVGGV